MAGTAGHRVIVATRDLVVQVDMVRRDTDRKVDSVVRNRIMVHRDTDPRVVMINHRVMATTRAVGVTQDMGDHRE